MVWGGCGWVWVGGREEVKTRKMGKIRMMSEVCIYRSVPQIRPPGILAQSPAEVFLSRA